jgi:outer membrane immunogenic protein
LFGRSQHVDNQVLLPAVFGKPETGSFNVTGSLGGATLGCGYQYTNFVLGVEGDFSASSVRGGPIPEQVPFNPAFSAGTRENWLGTFRGRLGYAYDRWLIYGTAGGAFADITAVACDPFGSCATPSQTSVGWVVGLGIEYAIWNNLSVKADYLHVDLGKAGFANALTPAGDELSARNVRATNEIFRMGLNYKFDFSTLPAPAPVVAKY